MAKYNRKYSKDQVEEATKNALCYSDVFRNLNLAINGGSYTWLKNIIKKYEISTIHFLPKHEIFIRSGLNATKNRAYNIYDKDDISNGNRKSADKLRKFLIFNKIEEKCNICNLLSWLDNPIRLDVDHINGNPVDNSLINLQFICPNCHRQKTIDIK